MNQNNKNLGLYIGCGTDIEIMSLLKDEFLSCIYIDSKPMTAYGDLKNIDEEFSQQYMIDFKNEANKYGFIKISLDGVYPHVYLNYETNQEIFHYYNLTFPIYQKNSHHTLNKDQIKQLKYKLRGVSHLIVIGFSPDYSILNCIVGNVTLIGNNSTLYKENLDDLLPYEHDKIIIVLQKNLYNVRNKIKNYIYFDRNNVRNEVDTYDEFISIL